MAADPYEERRGHRRVRVCAPLELRLLDPESNEPVSEWMHGLVEDASAGGVRLSALGRPAKFLERAISGKQMLDVRFVSLSKPRRIYTGLIRWVRPTEDGFSAGIQFQAEKQHVTDMLVQELHTFGHKRNVWPLRASMATAACLALALLGSWVGFSRAQASLHQQVLAEQSQWTGLSGEIDRLERELASSKQELKAEQKAREEAESNLTEAQSLLENLADENSEEVTEGEEYSASTLAEE